ncbi:MAG: hypothetical protein WCU74_03890, partial [Candidatus Omnitrophota bacterium]
MKSLPPFSFRLCLGRNAIWILVLAIVLGPGCARLFGWDIHAPGVLSGNFFTVVEPAPSRARSGPASVPRVPRYVLTGPTRIGLYLPAELKNFESRDRGGKTADPQTYHIGEAFYPMILEAFQYGFDEPIVLEAVPTAQIMARYDIPYLAAVKIK